MPGILFSLEEDHIKMLVIHTDNMNLLDALNHYTERVDGETVWEIKAGDKYPTIIGSPDR